MNEIKQEIVWKKWEESEFGTDKDLKEGQYLVFGKCVLRHKIEDIMRYATYRAPQRTIYPSGFSSGSWDPSDIVGMTIEYYADVPFPL